MSLRIAFQPQSFSPHSTNVSHSDMKRKQDYSASNDGVERDSKMTRVTLPSLATILEENVFMQPPYGSDHMLQQNNRQESFFEHNRNTHPDAQLSSFFGPVYFHAAPYERTVQPPRLNQTEYFPSQTNNFDTQTVTPQMTANLPVQKELSIKQSYNIKHHEQLVTTQVAKNVTMKPIRQLAFELGLSKDPSKNWRYRDVKRSLYEKLTPEHTRFIETHPDHTLLTQRLPNKLAMSGFVKRIILLAFHFTLRDGKEPKWFKNVRLDVINETMLEHDPIMYTRLELANAVKAQTLIISGVPFTRALEEARIIT
jgi:hypothetical protein